MPTDDSRPILAGGEKLGRQVDRPGTGGAGKYHPVAFRDAVTRLAPQVIEVERLSAALPTQLRGKRVIFEATLLPNYLAPSYFPAPVLEATGLRSVGSRRTTETYQTKRKKETRTTKALLLSGTEGEVDELRRLLTQPEEILARGLRDAIVEFSEIHMPREEVIVRRPPEISEIDGYDTWEAVLHRVWAGSPLDHRRELDSIFEKWISYIQSLNGEVVERYRRVVEGLTFVPVRLPPDRVQEAAAFNPLRAIRPMPKLRPIITSPFRSLSRHPPLPPPPGTKAATTYRVAVFDGGLDPHCPYCSPFVRYTELTPEPPSSEGVQHGSAVTTTILYGYCDGAHTLNLPNVLVDHYRVVPPPASEHGDLELNWMLDQIVEKVTDCGYRLVNLSLGPDLCVDDDGEPSRWTAELDTLARKADVLFVSAAGNNGLNVGGLDRIQVPCDMANGLGVGAVSTASSATDFERAPYSARGPGRWGARVQPIGVCFGGGLPDNAFVAIGPRGRLLETRGTSFSAPMALHGLSNLLAIMGPSRANQSHLLKAFAAHFAQRRRRNHDLTEVGFGLLRSDYRPVLQCDQDEVTVIYNARLHRDNVVGFALPVPEGIEANARVHVRWTLCYSSPVDPAEALDYTRAGVWATFRPHMRRTPVYNAAENTTEVYDYEEENEAFVAAITRGGVPSSNPASDPGREIRLDEQRLRDAGKWETTVHHRFSRKASKLYRPRLDISYYMRNGGSLVNAADAEDLDATLLVTVQGPSGLYASVRQQFDVLVPIAIEIEV